MKRNRAGGIELVEEGRMVSRVKVCDDTFSYFLFTEDTLPLELNLAP